MPINIRHKGNEHQFELKTGKSLGGTGKSLSEAPFFAEHGENILYTTCSPHVLILEFSCIELVIQLNEQSVVILWVS